MDYTEYNDKKYREYEQTCTRCGACCGAYDDPCVHLKQDAQGLYYCEIYAKRLGLRKTVKGETFHCVMVREIIHETWPGDHLCAYKQKYIAQRAVGPENEWSYAGAARSHGCLGGLDKKGEIE